MPKPSGPPPLPSSWREQEQSVSAVNSQGRVERKTITYYVSPEGVEFVWVRPGRFLRGSPGDEEDRGRDEVQRPVDVGRGFFMSATEVTREQYREMVFGDSPRSDPHRPVTGVTWDDAARYCALLTRRQPGTYDLPTETQWEYACRAGTLTPFNCGSTVSTDLVNYDGDYVYGNGREGTDRGQTVSVKSLPANQWGLYEMHGNVWEWCANYYDADYRSSEDGGDGPRALRGGSWNSTPGACRSANRNNNRPGMQGPSLGFRVVYTP
jgi:formylglycine-generating enzyme required for sulfatase activity